MLIEGRLGWLHPKNNHNHSSLHNCHNPRAKLRYSRIYNRDEDCVLGILDEQENSINYCRKKGFYGDMWNRLMCIFWMEVEMKSTILVLF